MVLSKPDLTFGHIYWHLVLVLHYFTVNYVMSCCFLTLYIYVTYVASCSTFLFWENYDQMTSLGKGWQKMENKWFLIWCQVIVFNRLKHVLSLWFPLCKKKSAWGISWELILVKVVYICSKTLQLTFGSHHLSQVERKNDVDWCGKIEQIS